MTTNNMKKVENIKALLDSHLQMHVDGKCPNPKCVVNTQEKVDYFWKLVNKDIERAERAGIVGKVMD